jgi:hypothetical protein
MLHTLLRLLEIEVCHQGLLCHLVLGDLDALALHRFDAFDDRLAEPGRQADTEGHWFYLRLQRGGQVLEARLLPCPARFADNGHRRRRSGCELRFRLGLRVRT